LPKALQGCGWLAGWLAGCGHPGVGQTIKRAGQCPASGCVQAHSRIMSNSTSLAACPRGTECALGTMECINARCVCNDLLGLTGPRCDELTLMSLPSILARAGEIAAFVPVGISYGMQLRRTWLAYQSAARSWVFRFLLPALALLLCGSSLMVADAVVSLLSTTATIHQSYVASYISFNLMSGVGAANFNLGGAVLPLLWCEIGLSSGRFRRIQRTLLLTRRLLGGYLFLNVLTVVGLAVISPIYPFHAASWLSLYVLVSILFGVLEYLAGTWLLSRAFRMTQGVQSEGSLARPTCMASRVQSESSLSRALVRMTSRVLSRQLTESSCKAAAELTRKDASIGYVQHATLQAKYTARRVIFFLCVGLIGIVLWTYARSPTVRSTVLAYIGSSLIKIVGNVGIALALLRYIRWTTEATMSSGEECLKANATRMTSRCRGSHHDSRQSHLDSIHGGDDDDAVDVMAANLDLEEYSKRQVTRTGGTSPSCGGGVAAAAGNRTCLFEPKVHLTTGTFKPTIV